MEIRLTPSGQLRWESSEGGAESTALSSVRKAFQADWREGLFTLAAESLVATAFLWPGVASMAKWRDVSLLFFCLSVYSVATVAGFGWLLLAMGLAQCGTDRPRTRVAYVGAFLAILLYREIPWLRVFAQGG